MFLCSSRWWLKLSSFALNLCATDCSFACKKNLCFKNQIFNPILGAAPNFLHRKPPSLLEVYLSYRPINHYLDGRRQFFSFFLKLTIIPPPYSLPVLRTTLKVACQLKFTVKFPYTHFINLVNVFTYTLYFIHFLYSLKLSSNTLGLIISMSIKLKLLDVVCLFNFQCQTMMHSTDQRRSQK